MHQRAEVTPKPERIKTAAEYLQSGKTMVAWSKERRINRFTLHNWVEEYRREAKLNTPSREWLEVSVNAPKDENTQQKEADINPATATYTPIRVSIGRAQIEIAGAFDENALAAVIKAVSSQC